jgi:histidinol-phosphatase
LSQATRLHVSGVSSLEDASLSYSSLGGWGKLGLREQFLSLTDDVWRTRAYGDFWSYMLVAEGAVDAAMEPELELYDMAALVPIVTEAGGTFTSVDGSAQGPWGGNAIASNGVLHEEILERLRTE